MPQRVRLYAVQARSLPTFYLDPAVQGIVSSEHARLIATEIVGPDIEPISVEPIYEEE